jgi:hypothetical protein
MMMQNFCWTRFDAIAAPDTERVENILRHRTGRPDEWLAAWINLFWQNQPGSNTGTYRD